jgi:hypothetical protein
MGAFLSQNIISIIFGITTVISSAVALYYQRLEHRLQVEEILDEGRRAGLFLSREAMIRYLLKMYDEAERGDVIWAQCVRCTDFTPAVRKQILKAAGQGVRFRMIINQCSPSLKDFQALFEPLHRAALAEGPDNAISLQGLSDKEVVIAFPGVESYTAILIRDRYFARIIKTWFDTRFNELAMGKGRQRVLLDKSTKTN